MQRKQIQGRAAVALTLAVALVSSVAPLSRPAEAFGGVAAHGSATSAVTVSAIDPASVQPGPGTVSPSSVNPGNPTGGTPQTAATPTSAAPSAASGTMKSDDKFQPETAPNGKRARAGSLIVW